MMRTLPLGLIAGAAGRAALDVTTYGDMLLRDRPASNVPAKVVDEALAGLERSVGGAQHDGSDDEEDPGPRGSALGGLSGFAVALALGAVYALLRSGVPASAVVPRLAWSAALSAGAMVLSDVPVDSRDRRHH